MSDWTSVLLPPFPVIHTYSQEALDLTAVSVTTAAVTSATVVQNQAYYYPFRLDIGATAMKLYYITGGTQNGNVDMGIYDSQFNSVVTMGSTAQGAANTLNELDITNTDLPPGNYWLAFASNSATATVFQNADADELSMPGSPYYVQASAFALPTPTATPVKSTAASPAVLLLGVSFDTLI